VVVIVVVVAVAVVVVVWWLTFILGVLPSDILSGITHNW